MQTRSRLTYSALYLSPMFLCSPTSSFVPKTVNCFQDNVVQDFSICNKHVQETTVKLNSIRTECSVARPRNKCLTTDARLTVTQTLLA